MCDPPSQLNPDLVVLGIDAAWTATRPSGVALAVRRTGRWTLCAVSPSYAHFLALARGDAPDGVPTGTVPDVAALLDAAQMLAGTPVTLVAIDMPLAHAPIVARRPSDDAIARAFGAWHCATHSPNADRPGALSDALRADFAAAGYPLRTRDARAGGLIEVYPHPALVRLAGGSRRLPYKAGNSAKYWPGEPLAVRRGLLHAQWQRIAALLATRFDGVADHLPPLADRPSGVEAKAHEDMLDAIVCAWVGVTALEGAADAYGDDGSAIWVPRALPEAGPGTGRDTAG
jgi:predicted RNase H-like nuclease